MNLNPFKKKEDYSFKLDDYSLPSLSESNTQSLDVGNEFSPGNDFSSNQNQSNDFSMGNMNAGNNFSTSSLASSNPFPTQNTQPMMQETKSMDNNYHNDLSKAKLETIEAKTALIEARLSSMEHKLELIFQMLSHEVSDETRRKIKVDGMMNNFRK